MIRDIWGHTAHFPDFIMHHHACAGQENERHRVIRSMVLHLPSQQALLLVWTASAGRTATTPCPNANFIRCFPANIAISLKYLALVVN